MFSQSTTLLLVALAAFANAHSAILAAQGEAGSPASVGFKVVPDLARNCTSISPCQGDATLIRDAEIAANVVNPCGRTELSGNIDVGEETENALAAKKVTAVKPGTVITMTIHQVNADGAGPYVCDLDETSNAAVFQNLTVTDNIPGANGLSQVRAQDFQMKVTLPQTLNCIGGSTGNICTVRCRNNAQAGPFGGCFAVQQVDKQGNVNAPSNIKAFKDLKTVLSQVQQNNADLGVANAAIAAQGSTEGKAAFAAAAAIIKETIVKADFPVQTPDVILGAPAAPAAPAATGAPANNTGNNNAAKKNNNNNAAKKNNNAAAAKKNNAGAAAGAAARRAKRFDS